MYPSILAIGEVWNKNRRLPFSFSKIQRDEILSDILKLKSSKACQDTVFPQKSSNFNDSIEKSNLPSILKTASITPVFKKGDKNSKDNYRPVTYFRIYLKSLRDAIFGYYPILWFNFCQNISVVFGQMLQYTILFISYA